VFHDICGLYDKLQPKFSKCYANTRAVMQKVKGPTSTIVKFLKVVDFNHQRLSKAIRQMSSLASFLLPNTRMSYPSAVVNLTQIDFLSMKLLYLEACCSK